MKKAKDPRQALEIGEKFHPGGWIQWKGTDVCMDVSCKCGYSGHIDADFAYHFRCPECKTVYAINGHVEFIELEEEPIDCVIEPEE